MQRINVYIDENSCKQLKSLSGTISENVRSAIYEYLRKLSELNVSSSQSERRQDG